MNGKYSSFLSRNTLSKIKKNHQTIQIEEVVRWQSVTYKGSMIGGTKLEDQGEQNSQSFFRGGWQKPYSMSGEFPPVSRIKQVNVSFCTVQEVGWLPGDWLLVHLSNRQDYTVRINALGFLLFLMTSEKPETERSYGNLLIIRIKNKGQFSPIPEKKTKVWTFGQGLLQTWCVAPSLFVEALILCDSIIQVMSLENN